MHPWLGVGETTGFARDQRPGASTLVLCLVAEGLATHGGRRLTAGRWRQRAVVGVNRRLLLFNRRQLGGAPCAVLCEKEAILDPFPPMATVTAVTAVFLPQIPTQANNSGTGGGGDWCLVKLAVVNLAVGNLAEAPGFRAVNLADTPRKQA